MLNRGANFRLFVPSIFLTVAFFAGTLTSSLGSADTDREIAAREAEREKQRVEAAFEKLMGLYHQPRVYEVEAAFEGLLDSPYLPKVSSDITELLRLVRSHGPEIIAAFEKAYPGGTYLGMGRDSAFLVDLLEIFYRSLGQDGRVEALELGRDSFNKEKLLAKYLTSKGFSPSELRDGPFFVPFDSTNFKSESQSTKLLNAIRQLCVTSAKCTLADFINKVGFINTGEKKGMYRDNIFEKDLGLLEDTMVKNFDSFDFGAIVSVTVDSSFIYNREYHGSYAGFMETRDNEVVPVRGNLARREERKAIIREQIELIKAVRSPEFLKGVQTVAKDKFHFEFPLARMTDPSKIDAIRGFELPKYSLGSNPEFVSEHLMDQIKNTENLAAKKNLLSRFFKRLKAMPPELISKSLNVLEARLFSQVPDSAVLEYYCENVVSVDRALPVKDLLRLLSEGKISYASYIRFFTRTAVGLIDDRRDHFSDPFLNSLSGRYRQEFASSPQLQALARAFQPEWSDKTVLEIRVNQIMSGLPRRNSKREVLEKFFEASSRDRRKTATEPLDIDNFEQLCKYLFEGYSHSSLKSLFQTAELLTQVVLDSAQKYKWPTRLTEEFYRLALKNIMVAVNHVGVGSKLEVDFAVREMQLLQKNRVMAFEALSGREGFGTNLLWRWSRVYARIQSLRNSQSNDDLREQTRLLSHQLVTLLLDLYRQKDLTAPQVFTCLNEFFQSITEGWLILESSLADHPDVASYQELVRKLRIEWLSDLEQNREDTVYLKVLFSRIAKPELSAQDLREDLIFVAKSRSGFKTGAELAIITANYWKGALNQPQTGGPRFASLSEMTRIAVETLVELHAQRWVSENELKNWAIDLMYGMRHSSVPILQSLPFDELFSNPNLRSGPKEALIATLLWQHNLGSKFVGDVFLGGGGNVDPVVGLKRILKLDPTSKEELESWLKAWSYKFPGPFSKSDLLGLLEFVPRLDRYKAPLGSCYCLVDFYRTLLAKSEVPAEQLAQVPEVINAYNSSVSFRAAWDADDQRRSLQRTLEKPGFCQIALRAIGLGR